MKLTFILILIAGLSAIASGGEYVVIVNKDSPLSEVSTGDLKFVYVGKVKDIKGTKVTPANMASESPAAKSFLDEIVGMNSVDYKSFWMAQQIRGGSSAPVVKKTADAMIEYIKENPEALGYVPKETPVEGVKVLTIK